MRNEKINAYSLHHKAYQDKRSLYYLFTLEFGVIHGIGKRGVPQFVPLTLLASGKKSLKTLQDINAGFMVDTLGGEQQYAALYLNEVLLKLLPIEDPVPVLFNQYAATLSNLRKSLSSKELRLVLRLFEAALFEQIGYSLDYYQDIDSNPIDANSRYKFIVNEGWMKIEGCKPKQIVISELEATTDIETIGNVKEQVSNCNEMIVGSLIITMQQGVSDQNLSVFSWLHRQLIDHLFDYKPLQSRLLWQQFNQYR